MTAPAQPETFDVTVELAEALVAEQFPDLADLPVRMVDAGWDNATFRLGERLALRIPRRLASAHLIEHERLGLPVALAGVPSFADGGLDAGAHVRDGMPGCGYPWRWAVVPWYDGRVVASAKPDDPMDAATRLGRFLAGLHRPAPDDAPPNPWRGGRLADRQGLLVEHLDRVDSLGRSLADDAVPSGVGRSDVERVFGAAAGVPGGAEPRVWLHADLHSGNLIVREGVLRAVVDFGDVTSGDRATDLSVAWTLFPESVAARERFRAVAGAREPIDDPTWARARGWAIALNLAFVQGPDGSADRLRAARRAIAGAVADG